MARKNNRRNKRGGETPSTDKVVDSAGEGDESAEAEVKAKAQQLKTLAHMPTSSRSTSARANA